MAKWHGKNVFVAMEDNPAILANKQWRFLGVDVDSIDVPSDLDTVEVSGFGDTKKNYVVGLADSKVSMKGAFDDAATAVFPAASGAHTVLSALIGGTGGYGIKVGPKGSASGYPVFQGSYLLSKYNLSMSIGGAVKYDAEFVPFSTNGGSWTTFA